MTNYVIKKGDYKPLSDIMEADYDTTKEYIVHVNKTRGSPLQVLTTTETPTNEERGLEYGSYDEFEIEADTGDDVYLRSDLFDISIDIKERTVA